MVYHSLRRRLRQQPLRWVLAILLSATLLLLFSPHAPGPMMHDSRGPPPHGHDHHHPDAWTEQTWRLSVPELKALVAGTEGYYVRDWSVGLGWNNLRYIIEASLLHAKLLNRVLVLPSFVYARSCEDICTQYGLFVDRSEVIGWDTWHGAPLNSLAWQIPIQLMLDLPHLREVYPVVLASEFFELHGLDPGLESLAGDWNRGEENTAFPSLHVIPNDEYDPSNVIRVDTLQGLPPVDKVETNVDELLRSALGDQPVLEWDIAVQTLQDKDWKVETDADIERLINSGGWVVTYTFLGAGGMDYTKTVVDPIRQVVPRNRIRGVVEDYTVTAEILLLEGETHLGRKPGGLRFTTDSARDDYARLVLYAFRPILPIRTLVKSLANRMSERCGGRMWMSAHMRRGDFAIVGWAMEKTLEGHFKRVQEHLDVGRGILEQIAMSGTNASGVALGSEASQLALPLEGDPIFLATDEHDPNGMAYLRNNSAVLIYDLLTIEDRRKIGWPLLFTDILALIEQSLATESYFFYGHALSSFAGGVLNMRAARGADPRTTWID
ncbi:hypothetical protein JB92DRAFT_3082720 [Gautieria morchelliformis]|nr:hypothetical protein JB92DRAFT_3082720 [Gautieria morchelliformis]